MRDDVVQLPGDPGPLAAGQVLEHRLLRCLDDRILAPRLATQPPPDARRTGQDDHGRASSTAAAGSTDRERCAQDERQRPARRPPQRGCRSPTATYSTPRRAARRRSAGSARGGPAAGRRRDSAGRDHRPEPRPAPPGRSSPAPAGPRRRRSCGRSCGPRATTPVGRTRARPPPADGLRDRDHGERSRLPAWPGPPTRRRPRHGPVVTGLSSPTRGRAPRRRARKIPRARDDAAAAGPPTVAAMAPSLEVRDVRKRYRGTVAVDGLSFTVRPGEVTGFVGPNGAGKSTTMRLILGLDAPDERRGTGQRPPLRARLRQAADPGRCAARRGRRAPRPAGPRPPAVDGPQQRHRRPPRRRGARPGRPRRRGAQAGGRLLARHAAAARHRRRAARRPAGADVRRAGQRARPGRHRLDPGPHAVARRAGPGRAGLQPPDERAGGHRRPARRHRPGPARRRHQRGRPARGGVEGPGRGGDRPAGRGDDRPGQRRRDRHRRRAPTASSSRACPATRRVAAHRGRGPVLELRRHRASLEEAYMELTRELEVGSSPTRREGTRR